MVYKDSGAKRVAAVKRDGRAVDFELRGGPPLPDRHHLPSLGFSSLIRKTGLRRRWNNTPPVDNRRSKFTHIHSFLNKFGAIVPVVAGGDRCGRWHLSLRLLTRLKLLQCLSFPLRVPSAQHCWKSEWNDFEVLYLGRLALLCSYLAVENVLELQNVNLTLGQMIRDLVPHPSLPLPLQSLMKKEDLKKKMEFVWLLRVLHSPCLKIDCPRVLFWFSLGRGLFSTMNEAGWKRTSSLSSYLAPWCAGS